MIEAYIASDKFIFRHGAKQVGTLPFDTLELQVDKSATEDHKFCMGVEAENFYPGEVYNCRGLQVVLGPTREFTHEVTLHGVGNVDKGQYSDVATPKTVRCCGVEEAVAATMHYQSYNCMGGGNCGRYHGIVWELPVGGKGKRKRVGEINYAGRYDTIAEIKAWEKSIEEKYSTTK